MALTQYNGVVLCALCFYFILIWLVCADFVAFPVAISEVEGVTYMFWSSFSFSFSFFVREGHKKAERREEKE